MKQPIFTSLLIVLLLTGCARLMGSPAASVEERVNGYWTEKMAKRWDRAYDFYCPAIRTDEGRVAFIQSANLDITGYRIDGVTLSEDQKQATVDIVFDLMIQGFHLKGMKIKENWSYADGNWCIPKMDTARSLFDKKK